MATDVLIGGFSPLVSNPTGTAGGDLSGSTYPNPSVAAISGASPILITPATLQWLATTSSPTITQATPASDVATANLSITAQAPFASAATNVTAGNILLAIPASVSGTNSGLVKVLYNSSSILAMGPYQGLLTDTAIWGSGTPSSTNYIFLTDQTNTFFNAPLTAGNVNISAANSAYLTFNKTGTSLMTIATGVANPTIAQATTSAGSGTTLTIAAQPATGASNNGGSINIAPGTSGSATAGVVNIQGTATGSAATLFTAGKAGFQCASTSLSIAAGGTITLTAAQYQFGYIILTGSLAGNATVVFPAQAGAEWIVDATGVTLNANTITLQANSVSWATTVGVTNVYSVAYGGAGKLYGTALTP